MLATQKDIVRRHYPEAVCHYSELWNKDRKRFVRTYTVYMTNELCPYTAGKLTLGSGADEYHAWQTSLFAIQKGYK
jgi:hypothetical protein